MTKYTVQKWVFNWNLFRPACVIGGRVYFGWYAIVVGFEGEDKVTRLMTPLQVDVKRNMGYIE